MLFWGHIPVGAALLAHETMVMSEMKTGSNFIVSSSGCDFWVQKEK